ncbi:hypothetical protein VAA_02409 [Vibrio anguillarum 775]|nr:hypothetical protein VAA_02409 [Vibrio anguillarum 775]
MYQNKLTQSIKEVENLFRLAMVANTVQNQGQIG